MTRSARARARVELSFEDKRDACGNEFRGTLVTLLMLENRNNLTKAAAMYLRFFCRAVLSKLLENGETFA